MNKERKLTEHSNPRKSFGLHSFVEPFSPFEDVLEAS